MLCNIMLLVNILWDFISVVAIWSTSCTSYPSVAEEPEPAEDKKQPVYGAIAGMHTSMWTRHADTRNHAACMLMAWWVLTLGFLRFMALYRTEFMIFAVVSYGIEGCAFFIEGLKSTMIPGKACPAAIFSLICLVVCLACMP
jgi:hypothetical protein